MITVVNGKNANDVWGKLTAQLLDRRISHSKQSRGGPTREILHAAFSISDPRQRFITSRYPAINPAFALAEVLWILEGSNESAFLNFFNSQLSKFAGGGRAYYGAYGYRLRDSLGIDQLKRAYQALHNNPETRQVVLQIWDSGRDLPYRTGKPRSKDIPCNLVSMLKVQDKTLEWSQIIRSNDIFLGVPHNIIQFTALQEVMAGWLGLELGSYNQFSDSLHAYNHDIEKLTSLDKEADIPSNPDDLRMPMKLWDRMWPEYWATVRRLTDGRVRSSLPDANPDWPTAYSNIYHILKAEAARRRRLYDIESSALESNNNPLYRLAYSNWANRLGRDVHP